MRVLQVLLTWVLVIGRWYIELWLEVFCKYFLQIHDVYRAWPSSSENRPAAVLLDWAKLPCHSAPQLAVTGLSPCCLPQFSSTCSMTMWTCQHLTHPPTSGLIYLLLLSFNNWKLWCDTTLLGTACWFEILQTVEIIRSTRLKAVDMLTNGHQLQSSTKSTKYRKI